MPMLSKFASSMRSKCSYNIEHRALNLFCKTMPDTGFQPSDALPTLLEFMLAGSRVFLTFVRLVVHQVWFLVPMLP